MSCHAGFEELVQCHWLIATARVNANHGVRHRINDRRDVGYLITAGEEYLEGRNINILFDCNYSCSSIGKHNFGFLIKIFLAVGIANFITLHKISYERFRITQSIIIFHENSYHSIPHTLWLSFNNISIVQRSTSNKISRLNHRNLKYSTVSQKLLEFPLPIEEMTNYFN